MPDLPRGAGPGLTLRLTCYVCAVVTDTGQLWDERAALLDEAMFILSRAGIADDYFLLGFSQAEGGGTDLDWWWGGRDLTPALEAHRDPKAL